jgi:UDP:flavonoid glycosyltransferase YjiC (YdhE family)
VVFAVQLLGKLCNITSVVESEAPWQMQPLFALELIPAFSAGKVGRKTNRTTKQRVKWLNRILLKQTQNVFGFNPFA